MFKNTLGLLKRLKVTKNYNRKDSTVSSESSEQDKYASSRPISLKLSPQVESLYGGRYFVTMIIGVGTGVELMQYVEEVLRWAHAPVDFDKIQVHSMEDLDEAIVSIRRNGAAIKSNIETEEVCRNATPNALLRRVLDLHLNIVHCKPYSGLTNAKFADTNIALIRQNTEGEYAMLEHESVKGVVESMKIITKYNSDRIAKGAYEFADANKRKKVTIVHKANIMKLTDGLFLKQCTEVGAKYPNIKTENMLVDNCCMQLVNNLKQFDVIVMPNLYGSIVSNILCGMLGGPGLYAGNNYGQSHAVFEPAARSVGLEIANKNIANPTAMLNAAVALLYHLRLDKYAYLIDKAITKTLCEDKIHTPDLAGSHTSTDVINKIKENISAMR